MVKTREATLTWLELYSLRPLRYTGRFVICRLSRTPVYEGLLVVLLVLLAFVLRVFDIGILPTGLHGDEAIAGLEGQRILRRGYIGPYSPSALGQPAGPLYITAASVRVFGNTIFAVRVVSALAGALTAAAMYVVVRRSLGFVPALLGSLILTVLNWHLHMTRIGFPLAWWPLVTLLATGTLIEALRWGTDWRWWGATGSLLGMGVYTYNADPPLLGILLAVALAGIALLVVQRKAPTWRVLTGAGVMVLVIALSLIPIARYALDERYGYLNHFRAESILRTPQYEALGLGTKLGFWKDRYLDFWGRVSFRPFPDNVDGTGLTQMIPTITFVLFAAGIVVAVRYRRPIVYVGYLVVLLMPFASVTTIDGLARRTFVMTPFIALFAALPLAAVLELAHSPDERPSTITLNSRSLRGIPGRVLAATQSRVCCELASLRVKYILSVLVCLFVGVVVVAVAYQNLDLYFGKFAHSDFQRFVFTDDITDASRFMSRLPRGRYVYFYSDRWSFNYETRQFLAPGVRGEDRSAQYGRYGFGIQPHKGKPVFLLVGAYKPLLASIRSQYPGGRVVYGRDNSFLLPGRKPRVTFVAYILP